MIAKVIPVEKRGVWSGVGHSIGAVMGIFGAVIVGKVLASYGFPINFAFLFALSFSLNCISFLGLALNREPPSLKVNKRLSLKDYLKKLPQILSNNVNYRRFLISRSTILVGTMATGFYIVYGTERFLEGSSVANLTGLLTAVLITSQAIFNLIWGYLGDRVGHKAVLSVAAFLLMIAAALAFLASAKIWLILTFIFLGTYLAADQVSGLTIILEFCEEADRPTYIGLTNTLLAPLVALIPLVGGWLASSFGFPLLFAVASFAALLGGLAMTFWVKEPRVKKI
jgi:MFS family permease